MNVPADIQTILQTLAPLPSAYLNAARQIAALPAPGLKNIRVAIAATFTIELLKPYLAVEAAARGLRIESHFAPFNQLELQLTDPASATHRFQPDAIAIAARLEDFAPELCGRFARLTPEAVAAESTAVTHRLAALIRETRRHSPAKIFIANFAPPQIPAAGLADAALAPSQISAVQKLNDDLAAISRATPDVFIFDYARLVAEHGLARWHDAKMNYLGRIPLTTDAQIATAKRLSRHLRAAFVPPCKCLVLDLDQTLWGGILGEEGLGGIALGEEYPGRVFKDFQRHLLALRDRGILLAIASKNNEADAREVFEKHPDSVLRWDDFAAREINWSEKTASLANIARALNIGTDALAFFDDNPVERELVRTRLPEVTVIEAPASSLGYIAAVEDSGAFDLLTLSAEDRRRGEMYAEQKQREQLATAAASPEEFLQSLQMRATVGVVDAQTIERVAQLVAKTNQFNLTTRRHDAARIEAMLREGAAGLWLRVADRFGDNGLVGVALALPDGARWRLDTFLLSCRVIGRQAETVLLGKLLEKIAARGGKELVAEFIPSAKNSVAADFLPKHGFKAVGGENHFTLTLAPDAVPLPKFFSIETAP